jgi:hypothetical protein
MKGAGTQGLVAMLERTKTCRSPIIIEPLVATISTALHPIETNVIYDREIPNTLPIPNVNPAATIPMTTCLNAENEALQTVMPLARNLSAHTRAC